MKIAFFETQGWEEKFVNQKLGDNDIRFFEHVLDENNIFEVKDYEVISVFIYSNIDKALLDKLPNLKLIATRSTGFDHIDIEECTKRGIYVCNVPIYGENTVAEHTFALILAISRNVHKAYLRTTREDYRIEGLKGFDLKSKTLGVIGTGSIGMHVIKIAKGFGMNVIAYDHHPKDLFAEVLNYKYAEFDEVLANSDIVTLHIPYNQHTHHLINSKNIAKFKKGSILINTARGGIVETQALIKALDEGILSNVGIDVLEGEDLILEEKQLLYEPDNIKNMTQLVKDHILLSKENVVFTPHIAFYSQEALERIINTTIENIQSYLEIHKAK